MKIKYKINRQTIDKFMEKYHFYFICPELKTMLLALADKPKEKCQHRWKNSRWGNEEFCVKCFAYKPNSLKTKPEIEKIEDKIRRILMLNFREYVEERIKSAHLKWNKEMREMIRSNKKEELPIGCGHNLYGYNLALDQLLKQLEEKP